MKKKKHILNIRRNSVYQPGFIRKILTSPNPTKNCRFSVWKCTSSHNYNNEGNYWFSAWSTAAGANLDGNDSKKQRERVKENTSNLQPQSGCQSATAAVWMWWFITGSRSDVGKRNKSPGGASPNRSSAKVRRNNNEFTVHPIQGGGCLCSLANRCFSSLLMRPGRRVDLTSKQGIN